MRRGTFQHDFVISDPGAGIEAQIHCDVEYEIAPYGPEIVTVKAPATASRRPPVDIINILSDRQLAELEQIAGRIERERYRAERAAARTAAE